VTVGLPVYNGGAALERALEAIAAQTYPNLEILISDNGSTDATVELCRRWASADERIRFVRHAVNHGAAWNFNHVLKEASGSLFMWAAHDDVMHPDYVLRTQEILAARTEVVLCHSEAQPMLSSGAPAGDPYVGWTNDAPALRERWRTILRRSELHAAIYGLMRTDVARRTRGLLACVSADWIFMIEMSVLGAIAQVPQTLQFKRVPANLDEYHTRAEMLSYLGARSSGLGAQLRPSRAAVVVEALRALRPIGVSGPTRARLAADAVAIYLADGGLRGDVMETAAFVRMRAAGAVRRDD
jgi:glycosyltransferase involved in cell wall biosynthesis